MLQFGSMSCRNDQVITEFLSKFCSESYSHQETTIELKRLIQDPQYFSHRFLIFVRMFFWGYLSYEDVLSETKNRLVKEDFDSFSIFDRTEISSCLGPRLTSDLYGIDFQTSIGYRNSFDSNFSISTEFDINEVWCYTPPPTGFFSIVENIVNAEFLCALYRKQFKLDLDFSKWWRYPVPFGDLFDVNYDSNRQTTITTPTTRYLSWNVARDIVSKFNYQTTLALGNFKRAQYAKIKSRLQSWLNDFETVPTLPPESAIFFLRGGDKLLIETIPPPERTLVQDVQMLYKKSSDFMILSDDYDLAENFRKGFGKSLIHNITDSSRKGYFLHNPSTIEDVRTIVRNYLLLSSPKYSMSCPSSNIVNSAHWSNSQLVPTELASTPLARYTYL